MHPGNKPICRLQRHLDNSKPCDVDLLWKKMAKWSSVRCNNVIVTCSDGVLRALIEICMKFFFDSSLDTSSGFVRQPHKHPQCIVALISDPEVCQCHRCLNVEVNNCKIRPMSHYDAFYDAQILPHGLHPNPQRHPTKEHHWTKYLKPSILTIRK